LDTKTIQINFDKLKKSFLNTIKLIMKIKRANAISVETFFSVNNHKEWAEKVNMGVKVVLMVINHKLKLLCACLTRERGSAKKYVRLGDPFMCSIFWSHKIIYLTYCLLGLKVTVIKNWNKMSDIYIYIYICRCTYILDFI
jgi:hypothetical protein